MSTSQNDLIYTLANINHFLEKLQIFIEPLLQTDKQAIIFTPHVDRMKFEVQQYHKLNIKCAAYNHTVDYDSRDEIRSEFEDGKIQFLFATPVMYFKNSFFRNFVNEQVLERNLAYIVFDDAKFLFEYGYDSDFGNYRNLSELKILAKDKKWIVIAEDGCMEKLPEVASILQLQDPMVMKVEYEEKEVRHVRIECPMSPKKNK